MVGDGSLSTARSEKELIENPAQDVVLELVPQFEKLTFKWGHTSVVWARKKPVQVTNSYKTDDNESKRVQE